MSQDVLPTTPTVDPLAINGNPPSVSIDEEAQVQPAVPVQGIAAVQPVQQQLVYDLSVEDLVIRSYFTEPSLTRKMMPLLVSEMYRDPLNQAIIKTIRRFIKHNGRPPVAQEMVIGMAKTGFTSSVRDKFMTIVNTPLQPMKIDFIVSMIERFYQESMFEQLLMKCSEALFNHDTDSIRAQMPTIKDALNFSMHMKLGINLVDDAALALSRLRASTACIPSRLSKLREYTSQANEGRGTCGGWFRKAVSLLVGHPGAGKTLCMCSEAAFAVSCGYNVLYISLEMAEEKIWHRITANLVDKTLFEVLDMTPEECQEAIRKSKIADADSLGILNVKRFKTSATPTNIEQCMDEFETTYGQKVDLVVLDYMSILKADSFDRRARDNMFTEGEAKIEQTRDIMDERNAACLSAIQFGKSGYGNLDAGMGEVQGSSAYNNTADFIMTLTITALLRANNLYANMILKNRFGPADVPFCTKNDFTKMRWSDAADSDIDVFNTAIAEQQVQNNSGNGGRRRSTAGAGEQKEAPVPQGVTVNVTAGTEPPGFQGTF